jgi:hypothetical protein
MAKAKFICQDLKTGKNEIIELDEIKAFEAPMRVIKHKNRPFKIIEKKGSGFGGTLNLRRNSAGVTDRESWNSGVHRDQVSEARGYAKTLHSGIEVKDNGTMKFSDRTARKVWLKAQGIVDRDGGYSD